MQLLGHNPGIASSPWADRFRRLASAARQILDGSDYIGVHADDLLWIFREWLDAPETIIPELMDAEERATYDALPEEFTVYRGCGPISKGGFSWSLDRDAAARFPFLARHPTDCPMLLTAKVSKSRVAAVKLRGREQEVIVVGLPDSAWTEEFLSEPTDRTVMTERTKTASPEIQKEMEMEWTR